MELSVSAHHSAHKAITCCFAAGLAAVLFRELVYSSLLEHTLTLVLAAVLSAKGGSTEKVLANIDASRYILTREDSQI